MNSIKSKSGKNITVRSLIESDLDMLYDYITELGNEDTFILINPQHMETYESEMKYVQNCIKKIGNDEMVKLLAFDNELLIGVADVTRLERRQQHIGRLGITLRKEHRGDGIGRKFMELVIQKSIDILKIKQVVLGCFANNQIGLNLYKSLGFKEYGRWPKGILYQDEYIDEILMYKHIYRK